MVESLSIRAVVYQDGEWWIAQCLEYDLCTSAKDRGKLTRKLASQLRLQIVLDLAKGKKPFQDLPRAPQRFWEMYSGSTPDELVQIRGSWLGNLFRIWRGRSQVQASISLVTA
ncbi:MAG TPA: hypothetical protein VHC97_24710 [Thermoanaerobaculia bacterium]|jgi:hypothetical protein|nr:hypothetical protein [Thermoanaerobaculia bacterium]